MGDICRPPKRKNTQRDFPAAPIFNRKGQEDEGGHDRPLAPGCCPGPISYGADGGGVGDVEGGAWEDLRGARFAWIGGQLSWWGLQPDRALQDEDLDGEQG